ncbi:MAG: glycosyltransferase family protein [Patescibacteria group bacterium]
MNLCIIQARMGSTRLPNKVLMSAKDNMTMLEYEIKRVQLAKKIHKIVIATTDMPGDDQIQELCTKIGVDCFRGSEDDVLERYAKCAEKYPGYENIIRLTGDCPLIDPAEIDKTIGYFEANDLDFASNCEANNETLPDGMDTEIFSRKALEQAARDAKLKSEREHVTLYIRNSPDFRKGYVKANEDFSHFRLTLDEQADHEVIKFVIENTDLNDGYLKFISVLTKNPEVMEKNIKIKRNQGLVKSLSTDGIVQ